MLYTVRWGTERLYLACKNLPQQSSEVYLFHFSHAVPHIHVLLYIGILKVISVSVTIMYTLLRALDFTY